MSLARIVALLKETIGLDETSIGVTSVERAIRERLKACRMQEMAAYCDHLRASQIELQELIDAVIVPETWFFRDREALSALVRLAQERWPSSRGDSTLRVLSLPCSTGEEPYSIVMALLDAGFPLQRLKIDAVDVSTRAVAFARRATYGRNSFRGGDLSFRERHFTRQPDGYVLSDTVRQQVRFRHGNLFMEGAALEAAAYEAIFCRNVLIYFDRVTQARAIGVLTRLLSPRGVLFVGPSEAGLMAEHGFVSAKIPHAFAFHRAAPKDARSEPLQAKQNPVNTRALARPAPRAPRAVARPMSQPTATPPMIAPERSSVEEARRLADSGNLVEAMKQCERFLRQNAATADAFYLMGLLYEAQDENHLAREQYRKALYLDPAHGEVLVHLAVLLRRDGDAAGAQRLLDRVGRAEVAQRGPA